MFIPSNVVDAIKTTSPEILEAHGIIKAAPKKSGDKATYVCPACGNGSGRDGTGFVFTLKGSIWVHNCPRCGRYSGDNINLFADKYGLDERHDFVEICRRACRDLGIACVEDPYRNFVRVDAPTFEKKFSPPPMSAAEIERKAKIDELIRADIAAARENLHNLTVEDMRGLTWTILEAHGVGYLPQWLHPVLRVDGKKIPPTPRLIIPTYGGTHYNAVLPQRLRSCVERQYWKMHAGTMETFALEKVTAATVRVVILEGELDAMSLEQSYLNRKFIQRSMSIFGVDYAENMSTGKIILASPLPEYAFIATLGAGRRGFVNEFNVRCKALGIKPLIVIMFDDDDAGHDGAAARKSELERLGYRVAVKFLKGKGDETVEEN